MVTGTGLVFLVGFVLFCFLVILTVFFIVVVVVAFVVLVVMAAAAVFHLPGLLGDDVVMPTLDGGVGASVSVDCSRVVADGVVMETVGVVMEMAGVVVEMAGVVVETIAVVVPMAIGLLGMARAAMTCPLLVVVVTSPTVVG